MFRRIRCSTRPARRWALRFTTGLCLAAGLLPAVGRAQQPAPPFEGRLVFQSKAGVSGDNPAAAELLANMLDHEMVVYVQGAHARVEFTGGQLNRLVILRRDSTQYLLDPREQALYTLPTGSAAAPAGFTVTPSSDTRTVAGFTCRRYDVRFVQNGVPAAMEVWAAPDLPAAAGINTPRSRALFEQIPGLPLRTVLRASRGGQTMTVTMDCTQVLPQPVPAHLFELPQGYERRAGIPPALRAALLGS